MSLLNNKKGKWIVGGICAFALVATASTGLAAWVIGTQSGDDANGNITVDTTIVDQGVAVTISDASDLSVYFGPDRYNPTAYVSASSAEDAAKVDLEFTIKGTVSWGENVDVTGLNFDFAFSETLLNSELINIPEGSTDSSVTVDDSVIVTKRISRTLVTGEANSVDFSETFVFTWNNNPCDWTSADGNASTLSSLLAEFKALNGTDTCTVYVNAIF